MVQDAGVHAVHVSTGSMFPHPRNPPGGFPLDVAEQVYPSLLGEGVHTFRNYLVFRYRVLRPHARWEDRKSDRDPARRPTWHRGCSRGAPGRLSLLWSP